jgi:hypothetical protein
MSATANDLRRKNHGRSWELEVWIGGSNDFRIEFFDAFAEARKKAAETPCWPMRIFRHPDAACVWRNRPAYRRGIKKHK